MSSALLIVLIPTIDLHLLGNHSIAEHLAREVGDRFTPSILREKVAAGHLGRKSGQGFHTW